MNPWRSRQPAHKQQAMRETAHSFRKSTAQRRPRSPQKNSHSMVFFDAWELAKERLRIPKRLGGLGLTDATSKCPVGRVACVIDCFWRGLPVGKADAARNQGTSNPAPARIPLFPSTLLDKMRRATGGSLVGIRPLLYLQTSIGEAFSRLGGKLGHMPVPAAGGRGQPA
jgi:hypothetical protein